MEYPSINIQGNIISSEILDKIRNEDIKFQLAADYGLDRKTSVRDEIGIAWAVTRAHWTAFKIRRDRLKEGESGTAETRNSWMIPLLKELGYNVEKTTVYIHPDTNKTYAISHKAANLGDFPIHIMGINDNLDKRRETSGPRLSPHALTQEYLNSTEHVYALVSNGRYLRLLRDATRLVRLSYLEINLEKMMEEELYADFAIFFRLLHVTRMPLNFDQTDESYIEYYHQESLASGSRIREKLSKAVEASIKTLANGFLEHPANESLGKEIIDGYLKPDSYYTYQLRLIYRLLFLIVTEERNLIYPPSPAAPTRPPPIGGGDISRLRKIYYDHYSIERLRRLAGKFYFVDGRKQDLWEGLITTFRLFEDGSCGEKLGIKPLGSGIFSDDALGVLKECKLSNEALLKVIRNLTFFENDHRQLVRVNYSDLDVEEFGSVYEGLLEYKPVFQDFDGKTRFVFAKGDERSKSGAHYTPEELVKPLIKHSLDYIIEEKLNEQDKEKALLSIRVCDVASGSGHILLSAARRIALELARVRSQEDQPNPTTFRTAIRDVIKSCIYGVDKNPLAVELCKVALWLESHNPGEPLNFLDHRIKCGDSIVGLVSQDELKKGIPNEAFKGLPGDVKEVASVLLKRNKKERGNPEQLAMDFEGQVGKRLRSVLHAYDEFSSLPETTPDEIQRKEKAYKQLTGGSNWYNLRILADMMIAPFFIPKTIENEKSIATDAVYRAFLRGTPLQGQVPAKAQAVSFENKFFHWFLEFPEVFAKGGFDCILGNPPYLGGKKISSSFGDRYLLFLKNIYSPAEGGVDLVAYFLKRDYIITRKTGFIALIATQTIRKADTRIAGIKLIVEDESSIIYAKTNIKWPGEAGVIVDIFSLIKGINTNHKRILNEKEVAFINDFFDAQEFEEEPFKLLFNKQNCFQGCVVSGKGFMVELNEFTKLQLNTEVVWPFLIGDEINNDCYQLPGRRIIYFRDWNIDKAKKYTKEFEIIVNLVKPERDSVKRDVYRNNYWLFAERAKYLYQKIQHLKFWFVISKSSKYNHFSLQKESNIIYDQSLTVITLDSFFYLCILESELHNIWATKYCSSQGGSSRYNPNDAFHNFPFPTVPPKILVEKLDLFGRDFYDFRSQLLINLQLGLTKTYNAFHASKLQPFITSVTLQTLNKQVIEKNYNKEVWNLWNHLQKNPGTRSIEEVIGGIVKLRELHVEMDQAVLEAYGWSDIQLKHDFYEVDYLPENDRVRYTIHPDARREVLKRLLELNHRVHEEEVKELEKQNQLEGSKTKLRKQKKNLEKFDGQAQLKLE